MKQPLNNINPAKLKHSKWTAVKPVNKEKHFIVSRVKYDDDGDVTLCELEAVLTKRLKSIDWRSLKDCSHWIQGWQ